MKNTARFLASVLCLVLLSSTVHAIEKPWYIDYETQYGTKLTRDFSFGLNSELPVAIHEDTKSNFMDFKAELPDEMPVFAPYQDDEIAKSANKIYVSDKDGNDKNPGTIDKPVKTLTKALKLGEKYGMRKGGLTIYLREGTYSSTSGFNVPLELNGTETHPTFISAYPGEKVVITSAISVNGSDMKIADDEVADKKLRNSVKGKVYSINLKDLGHTDLGEFTETTRPSLYVNGNAYTIARWPNGANTGMVEYTEEDAQYGVINTGDIMTASGRNGPYTGDTGNGFEFVMSSSRPLTWENTGNIWMYGYWFEEWAKYHEQVDSFNEDKNSVKSVNHCSWGALFVSEPCFYFYNVLEELDIPGEWFIDQKTGYLYIYPTEDLKDKDVKITISASDGITLNNTQSVVINGININTTGKDGIYIVNSRKCIVQNCKIENVTTYTINSYGYNCGVLNNVLDGDLMVNSPAGDVNAGYRTFIPTRNFAQNNIVQGGITQYWGFQNIVSHNVVTGSPNHAITVMREIACVTEYNETVAGPNVNLDAGLIYVGCSAIHRGNHLRYNYLNRARPEMTAGPNAIYCDDMSSYNYSYGNIIREGKIFYHGGSDNVTYNNLIVDRTTSGASISNSDNYHVDAPRWESLIIADSDTRWSRQARTTYSPEWMERWNHDHELHSSLMKHKYEFEQPNYNSEIDEYGKNTAAPKYNYYGNNLMVNSNDIEAVSRERYSLYEDNVNIGDTSIFEDYENGIFNISEETLKKINPNMEPLPLQQKMGLIFDPVFMTEKIKLTKPITLSPANTVDEPIYENENINLNWSQVFGRSYYDVEVSETPEFETLVFSETVQVPSVTIPNLEYGKTYYWRVKAGTWSHNFDMTPSQSDTSVFRIGTQEEIELNTVIDLAPVNAAITSVKKAISAIEEDYKADLEKEESERVYIKNPVEEMTKIIKVAQQEKETEIKLTKQIEPFINDMITDAYQIWNDSVKPQTIEITGDGLTKESFKITGNAEVNINGDVAELKGPATAMIMLDKKSLIRPNTTVKTKIKYDKINAWTTVQLLQQGNDAPGPTQTTSYFVVFKPDVIELQRYPKDTSWTNGIVLQVPNNKEIVKDNQWFDFEYTLTYQDDGLNLSIKIDGKEYFNYTDNLTKNYTFDSIGFMINGANSMTYVK